MINWAVPTKESSSKPRGVKRPFIKIKEMPRAPVPKLLRSALDEADFARFEDDPQFDQFLIEHFHTTKEAIK